MDSIKEWWELRDSGHQKIIMIVGGLVALFAVFSMIPGQEKTERNEPTAEVEVDLLNGDLGNADMNQLFAKMKVQEKELSELRRVQQQFSKRQQQQQNALSAATQIADNPEQLGSLVNEMNRLKEDIQELTQNGVTRSSNVAPPPVQLVLGGEDEATEVRLPADSSGGTGPADPFSSVTDQDDGNSITSYDPLSAIKGAIEENVTDNSKTPGRFPFVKDSNFDRPAAKIVIEQRPVREEVRARTGGNRPGQTARDRRGELLDTAIAPVPYIPSNSLFEGVLLNGMDAPTSSGSAREPYPVTIRLTSLAFLPNRYTTNVRECFVGAAGFGRLDSERVHLRVETLSCVLHNGGVIDSTIQGYVTGEDGKVGLRGVVVERTGQLLMRAALAGLGSGFAEALRPQQIQSVRTGAQAGGIQFDAPKSSEVLEIGAYAGAAEAMEKLSDFYLDRADQIFPIIEIDAMRTVTIHLTAGLRLEPIQDATYSSTASNEAAGQ